MNVALQHDAARPGRCSDPWFVLLTYPNCERRAASRLADQGFPRYLPLRAAEGHEKLRFKDRPFFPGYLFARPHESGRWSPMRSTPGVSQVIMNGERPAEVSDRVVAELKAREVNGLIWLPTEDTLAAGTKVRVEWAGSVVDAIVRERRPHERVALLMTLFGREVETVAPVALVRPAAE